MAVVSTIFKVAQDATIKIPDEIWREAGVARPNEVKVEINAERITLVPRREPAPLTDEGRARFDLIGRLLRESFAGADSKAAWEEIHAGRQDR
jgi:hypothetical protein